MIIVDPPDRNFGSDEQWLEFFEEMQNALADAQAGGNGSDDIAQIKEMIALAEEVLAERGLGTPI